MDLSRWQKAKEILAEALECPPEDRVPYVCTRCGPDAALASEVCKLLEWAATQGDILSTTGTGAPSSSAQPMALGTCLGDYVIEREIGRGGAAIVYLATSPRHGTVALKVLFASTQIERFSREKEILASLEHPYIAALMDAGATASGHHYLVTRMVNGIPIDQYCAQSNLPMADRVALIRRVGEAVQHAHTRNIIHRDLKPANILVDQQGLPTLLDFGIAKLLVPESPTQHALTQYGIRPMTPAYASPEQLSGRTVTGSSDIYSLGVILRQLLTAVEPTCGAVPLRLAAIVRKAVEFDSERRYASMQEFLADLDRYQRGLPVEADKPALPSKPKPHAMRFSIAAVCLVLLVAAAAFAAQEWQARSRREIEAEARQRTFESNRKVARTLAIDLSGKIAAFSGSDGASPAIFEQIYQFLLDTSRDVSSQAARLDLAQDFLQLSSNSPEPGLIQRSAWRAQLLLQGVDLPSAELGRARCYFYIAESYLLKNDFQSAWSAFWEAQRRLRSIKAPEASDYAERSTFWMERLTARLPGIYNSPPLYAALHEWQVRRAKMASPQSKAAALAAMTEVSRLLAAADANDSFRGEARRAQ